MTRESGRASRSCRRANPPRSKNPQPNLVDRTPARRGIAVAFSPRRRSSDGCRLLRARHLLGGRSDGLAARPPAARPMRVPSVEAKRSDPGGHTDRSDVALNPAGREWAGGTRPSPGRPRSGACGSSTPPAGASVSLSDRWSARTTPPARPAATRLTTSEAAGQAVGRQLWACPHAGVKPRSPSSEIVGGVAGVSGNAKPTTSRSGRRSRSVIDPRIVPCSGRVSAARDPSVEVLVDRDGRHEFGERPFRPTAGPFFADGAFDREGSTGLRWRR